MPLFLLANWRWLAPTLAAAGLGLLLLVARAENSALRLDLAQIEAVSATTMAQAEKRAADALKRYSDLSIQTEKDHADAVAKIDAAYADAKRIVRLRDPGAHCSPSSLPSAPSTAGSNPIGTAPGVELSERATEGLTALAKRADLTLAYANACHDWAMQIGR